MHSGECYTDRPTTLQNVALVPNPSPVTAVVSKMPKANHIDVLVQMNTSPPPRFCNQRQKRLQKQSPDTSISIVTRIMEA